MLAIPTQHPLKYIRELKAATKDYRELTERIKRQIAALNEKKDG